MPTIYIFFYNSQLDVKGRDGNIQSNHIHPSDDDEEFHKRSDNALDGLAKEVKADYDRLHRIATNANPKEFEDEVARSLWKLAKEADFTPEELDSLRDELHHFQVWTSIFHYLLVISSRYVSCLSGRRDAPRCTTSRPS